MSIEWIRLFMILRATQSGVWQSVGLYSFQDVPIILHHLDPVTNEQTAGYLWNHITFPVCGCSCLAQSSAANNRPACFNDMRNKVWKQTFRVVRFFSSWSAGVLTAECSVTVSVGWLRTTHWAHLIKYLRTDGYQMRLSIKLLQLDRVHAWSRLCDNVQGFKGESREERMAPWICFVCRTMQMWFYLWKHLL